jgi:hypothetical protein
MRRRKREQLGELARRCGGRMGERVRCGGHLGSHLPGQDIEAAEANTRIVKAPERQKGGRLQAVHEKQTRNNTEYHSDTAFFK